MAKCQFMKPSLVVLYLGHYISKDGLMPVNDKVDAIATASEPTSTTELKS